MVGSAAEQAREGRGGGCRAQQGRCGKRTRQAAHSRPPLELRAPAPGVEKSRSWGCNSVFKITGWGAGRHSRQRSGVHCAQRGPRVAGVSGVVKQPSSAGASHRGSPGAYSMPGGGRLHRADVHGGRVPLPSHCPARLSDPSPAQELPGPPPLGSQPATHVDSSPHPAPALWWDLRQGGVSEPRFAYLQNGDGRFQVSAPRWF